MIAFFTWMERRRQLRLLRRMDDQQLEDIGTSRAILDRGVAAWPWRAPPPSMEGLGRLKLGPDAVPAAATAERPVPPAAARDRRPGPQRGLDPGPRLAPAVGLPGFVRPVARHR
jgi:hypothetical protein